MTVPEAYVLVRGRPSLRRDLARVGRRLPSASTIGLWSYRAFMVCAAVVFLPGFMTAYAVVKFVEPRSDLIVQLLIETTGFGRPPG